jgi:hypothetical protein
MDSVGIGAVLLAIVGGAGNQLGTQLWEGLVSLVRRPFRHKAPSSEAIVMVPSGVAELNALQQFPHDQRKAVALAEALLARSDTDVAFRQALEAWWQLADPIRANVGNVSNTISGGNQYGPTLQGRDFSNVSFGAVPSMPPSSEG